MTLRAALKHVVGSNERISVMVGRGAVAPVAEPLPVGLRIVADGAGFSLLRVDGNGASITHTWHPTIDEAMERAATEYGVARDEWTDG